MNKLIIILLILAILFWMRAIPLGMAIVTPKVETPVPTPTLSETKLESLVNEWREDHDYPPFIKSSELCTYALERVEEIKTDWSHDKFMEDGCSKTPFNYCGENLSRGYLYEEQTLEAWLNSPTHRENIEKDYKYMCIECSDGFCAQQFGK